MKRHPPAVPLPPDVLEPVVAELVALTGLAPAAVSALRGGRVADARVWIAEIAQASRRLARAADRLPAGLL